MDWSNAYVIGLGRRFIDSRTRDNTRSIGVEPIHVRIGMNRIHGESDGMDGGSASLSLLTHPTKIQCGVVVR
jgi:hypothetical protein